MHPEIFGIHVKEGLSKENNAIQTWIYFNRFENQMYYYTPTM